MRPGHMRRHRFLTITMSALLLSASCHSRDADNPKQDQGVRPVRIKEVLGVRFRQCQTQDAEVTLTVVLDIADLTSETWTIPLRQIPDDALANFDLPGGFHTGNAHGMNDDGDWGTTISIYVDDEPTPGVDVNIFCGWNAPDNRNGEIRTRLNVPFGQTFKKPLDNDVTLTATFVTAPRADRQPDVPVR